MSDIIAKVRKLLELSKSTNEHEAAAAAAKAAALMSANAITQAMVEVLSVDAPRKREPIVEISNPADPSRRVAWRERIACAVAESLGCEQFFWGQKLVVLGRESATQTWLYTCQHLHAEVQRLAREAWTMDGVELAAAGQRPTAWKNAFMLGAADTIAEVLRKQGEDRGTGQKVQAFQLASPDNRALALQHVTQAIALVEQDRAEVKQAFKARTSGPGWRKTPQTGNGIRGRGGYEAGREAGAHVSLGGTRGALKS